MSNALLKSEVEKTLGPEYKPFAGRAVDMFFRINADYRNVSILERSHIHRIISIAVSLAEVAAEARAQTQPKARPRVEYSADNLLRSEKAIEELRPEIDVLRLELFGRTQAPFKTLHAALRWLRKESMVEHRAFIERVGDQREKVKAIDKKIEKLTEERNRLAESYVGWKMDFSVPIPLAGCFFCTFPGTRLRKFALQLRPLASIFNFTEAGLAAHVLSGSTPVKRLLDITIHGPVLVKDVISFYKSQAPRFKHERRVPPRYLEVLEFVKARRGVPKKGKMKFWENASKAWNKAHRAKRRLSLDGLKRLHERAAKRKRLLGVTPNTFSG